MTPYFKSAATVHAEREAQRLLDGATPMPGPPVPSAPSQFLTPRSNILLAGSEGGNSDGEENNLTDEESGMFLAFLAYYLY
jgi:hypothetical protein